MANEIGYFPEYFEHVAGPLYDGADVPQPGESWQGSPANPVNRTPPAPAQWLDSEPFLTTDDVITTGVDIARTPATCSNRRESS